MINHTYFTQHELNNLGTYSVFLLDNALNGFHLFSSLAPAILIECIVLPTP